MGKQPIGAAMVSPFIIRVAALLLSFSATAVGQERTHPTAITIVPNTITSIPPLARAVMSGDRERVSKVLAETKDVNDPVRAKEGARAGFTPLILAVALSESDIAHLLIDRGADVTILDDYRRSALWYAAVQQNTDIAATLVDKAGTKQDCKRCGYRFRENASTDGRSRYRAAISFSLAKSRRIERSERWSWGNGGRLLQA
jgi:hypothetical protein